MLFSYGSIRDHQLEAPSYAYQVIKAYVAYMISPLASYLDTMTAHDSFSNSSTTVEITCPEDTTGIERIMLAAQGDLQRLLSSFFARPISVERVYANTSPRLVPASPSDPITQHRQVQLKCASRIVCIATSSVVITSPECERLFLEEKFAIGQLFRQLRVTPKFTLLNVETRIVKGRRELERTYMLETNGISCKITEVFPDRDMFVLGRAWLDDPKSTRLEMPPSDERYVYQEKGVDCGAGDTISPQALATAATLSSILYGRDVDPLIGQGVRGDYSALSARRGPDDDISYAHFAKLVEYQSSMWYEKLSPLLPAEAARLGADAPVVAVFGDSGLQSTITAMALLRLNVTVFFITPSDSITSLLEDLAARRVFAVIYDNRYSDAAHAVEEKLALPTLAREDALHASNLSSDLLHDQGKRATTLHDTPPSIPIIVHNHPTTAIASH